MGTRILCQLFAECPSKTPIFIAHVCRCDCYTCVPLQLRHNERMLSEITGVSSVCSTVGSSVDQRKHQSSASLAFVWGIHRWLVNSLRRRPVMWKKFPFDDVIVQCCLACHWPWVHLTWNNWKLLTQALLLNGMHKLDHCDVALLALCPEQSWYFKPNVIYGNSLRPNTSCVAHMDLKP